MRLYALVDGEDPEAIDVFLSCEDAQRALEGAAAGARPHRRWLHYVFNVRTVNAPCAKEFGPQLTVADAPVEPPKNSAETLIVCVPGERASA